MLNEKGIRELAYVVKINEVQKHPNADRLDIVSVGGWKAITGLNDFKPGDLAVYFETDSKLPEISPFVENEFLKSKHFRIKVQKIRGVVSDGLLVHLDQFGWTEQDHPEGTFVTEELGVVYNEPIDNIRKANSVDLYKSMVQRHPKIFSNVFIRKLYKTKIGKKILFFLFGKKKKNGWPAWVVKTDEERIQNQPWRFTERDSNDQKKIWIPTEKIDGSSATYTIRRVKRFLLSDKFEFLTCSRNVVFYNSNSEKLYYDTNIYKEIANKYDIENILKTLMKLNPSWEYCTLQGEIFGNRIQKRDYGMSDIDFRAFNFITSVDGRWNSNDGKYFLKDFGIEWVPVFEQMTLPDTLEELMEYVESKTSVIDNGLREGIVFRSLDGKESFKCVSDKFRLKYHS